MGPEIISQGGNARLAAPAIQLPVSLLGGGGFFAMGGDMAATRRNRIRGRLADRPTVVGAPDVSARGYARFRHAVDYLETPFVETGSFSIGAVMRAPAPFEGVGGRPVALGNIDVNVGGIYLAMQNYTPSGINILGSATVLSGTSIVAANQQVLFAPDPLEWKLVIFSFREGVSRTVRNITDNMESSSPEVRPRILGTTRLRIGSTYNTGGAYGRTDLCSLFWHPNTALGEEARAELIDVMRADALLEGIEV